MQNFSITITPSATGSSFIVDYNVANGHGSYVAEDDPHKLMGIVYDYLKMAGAFEEFIRSAVAAANKAAAKEASNLQDLTHIEAGKAVNNGNTV